MNPQEAKRQVEEINESLHLAIKQLENSAQGLLFALPQEESAVHKALNVQHKDHWRLGCLIEQLVWLRDTSSKAGVSVFMRGKK